MSACELNNSKEEIIVLKGVPLTFFLRGDNTFFGALRIVEVTLFNLASWIVSGTRPVGTRLRMYLKRKQNIDIDDSEWPSGIQRHACCMRHRQLWVWAPNLHQYLQTHLQVCGSKRLGCHADLHTVSRCHTRGESEDHTSKKAHKKGSTLTLKPRADVTRSPKQGYQWPNEKGLFPPKIKKKNSYKSK